MTTDATKVYRYRLIFLLLALLILSGLLVGGWIVPSEWLAVAQAVLGVR